MRTFFALPVLGLEGQGPQSGGLVEAPIESSALLFLLDDVRDFSLGLVLVGLGGKLAGFDVGGSVGRHREDVRTCV
jgi:hypothetical protein